MSVLTNSLSAAEIHDASSSGDLAKVKALVTATPSAVSEKDYDGKTALHYAAANGHLEIVKFLVENKGDPQARSKNGMTPFALAKGFGKSEVVAYLDKV